MFVLGVRHDCSMIRLCSLVYDTRRLPRRRVHPVLTDLGLLFLSACQLRKNGVGCLIEVEHHGRGRLEGVKVRERRIRDSSDAPSATPLFRCEATALQSLCVPALITERSAPSRHTPFSACSIEIPPGSEAVGAVGMVPAMDKRPLFEPPMHHWLTGWVNAGQIG